MTTTTTETDPATDPETTETETQPGQGFLASLPAFRPRRQPPQAPYPAPDSSGDGGGIPTATATAAGQDDDRGGRARGTSTFTPASFKDRAKGYSAIAATLLRAAGGWLNGAVRMPETDAFLPDEDDEEAITPPLGRLAARRIKLGADAETMTELEDIAQAGLGMVVWLAKGIGAVYDARRERRRAQQGRAVHTDTGDGTEPR